jgi:enamine deaminase RidA (YjgF/YER057c/UK114 family)
MSGQVGMRLDGTICEGIEAQAEQVFDNILALIEAAGMKKTDLVKIVTYCISPDHLAKVREVRGRKLGDHAPASTLLIIAGLANPKFLLEIEAEAVSEG